MNDTDRPEDRYAALVAQRWSAVVQRLGERRDAFEAAVSQRAAGHGLGDALAQARYLNLCFAFGPGFEDKTENEWALALLVDQRLRPEVKLHQLVLRATRELQRRHGDDQALRTADSALLDAADVARLRSDPRAHALPRQACDVEALEVRLLDTQWRLEYQRADGPWPRVEAPVVAPLRVDANHAAPPTVAVLTRSEGESEPTRLQVRQVAHGHCGIGLHPSVRWLGGHGITAWRDHEARSVAWPIWAGPEPSPPRLLAASEPQVSLLQVGSCGLRDEGVPLEAVNLQLWVYPAHQWLFSTTRKATLTLALPAEAAQLAQAGEPTRCTLERDGARKSAAFWQEGFDEHLRARLAQGLQRLFEAWQPIVQQPHLQAALNLLDGRAAVTWGWREGARGLGGPPLQRIVADLDIAAAAEIKLTGTVDYAGAKAQLRLMIDGQAALKTLLERLNAEPLPAEALAGAQLRWRWPVKIEAEPLADDSGIVFSEIGPCTGALVGSCGLRPCVMVGNAWEWFATLALEPVATRVVVYDPLLGMTESHMALLGSVQLLDWSVV